MFTCERIDLRDGDGQLEATGVVWTEHREWLEFAMHGLVTLGVVIAFFAFLTAPLFGKFWWIPCGVGVSTFLPFFWLCRADFQGTPRQLLFRRVTAGAKVGHWSGSAVLSRGGVKVGHWIG